MISFRVVKEPYGWAVRLGEGMMTPFQSQSQAVDHAARLVEALRQRGDSAEVVIEDCRAPISAPSVSFWLFRRQSDLGERREIQGRPAKAAEPPAPHERRQPDHLEGLEGPAC